MNNIIDTKLPGRPQFKRHEIVQSGEVLEYYSRNIIECIRALWGDPDFADDLIVEPERLYADEDMEIRIYHEMNTGKWWWETQVKFSSLAFQVESDPQANLSPIEKGSIRNTTQKLHDHSHHNIFRQNSAHSISWKDCLSCISYHRQHTQAYPPETFSTSPNLAGLSSDIKT